MVIIIPEGIKGSLKSELFMNITQWFLPHPPNQHSAAQGVGTASTLGSLSLSTVACEGNRSSQYSSEPDLRSAQQQHDADLPFEAKVYEVVIATTLAMYQKEFKELKENTDEVLKEFVGSRLVPFRIQEGMQEIKNKVATASSKVSSCCTWFVSLVAEDEEMALMNLSLLKQRPELYDTFPINEELLQSHELIEELLEVYVRDLNALNSTFNALQKLIESAERTNAIGLDTRCVRVDSPRVAHSTAHSINSVLTQYELSTNSVLAQY